MGIDAQMFVRTRTTYTGQAVRRMAVELCEAFGHNNFWIGEDWPIYDDHYEEQVGKGRHALEIIKKYTQDGDDILPEPGEQFIECYIATRYYGVGYERGNLPLILNVARWLHGRIPDAVVWYGGDSSGVCAKPLDDLVESALWTHYATVGHQPYTGALHSGGPWNFTGAPPLLCGFCDVAMHNTGGGRGEEFYRCAGCGKVAVGSPDGRVSFADHHKDIFELAREHRGEK